MAERRFHAPGRVNLIGEHTDYSGGLVLPAALDRGVTLSADGGGDRIRLTSDRLPEPVDVAADGSEPGAGWGRYVAAVAAELHALGRPPVGMAGTAASDLPTGAGLSSSAALEVVVAIALCALADHPLPPLEVAALAQRAELRAVGVPCGIMDQAASVLGEPDAAVLLDCGSLAHRTVPLPADLALIVIDSGVTRRLEESGYADRRRELEAGIAAAGERDPRSLIVDDLPALVDLDSIPGRRLRHVVTENARVSAVVALLEDVGPIDRAALGALFAEGHASLRDDFAVSTPALDLLVDLALAEGAVAARMTGGGFGGAIVALAPREDAATLAAGVSARYATATGGTATALVTAASAGAGETD